MSTMSPPGISLDLMVARAEQAAEVDLAAQIYNDILVARKAGKTPAFCELMWEVVGLVGEDGTPAEPPPVFSSCYGHGDSGDIVQNFMEVPHTGFDEEGNVIHIRQHTVERGDGGVAEFFTLVVWNPRINTEAGDWKILHNVDTYIEPDLETVPGTDNARVLEWGPDDPILKLVEDPETGKKEFYVGKSIGKNGWRVFSSKPLTSLHRVVERINQLEALAVDASESIGEVAIQAAVETSGAVVVINA